MQFLYRFFVDLTDLVAFMFTIPSYLLQTVQFIHETRIINALLRWRLVRQAIILACIAVGLTWRSTASASSSLLSHSQCGVVQSIWNQAARTVTLGLGRPDLVQWCCDASDTLPCAVHTPFVMLVLVGALLLCITLRIDYYFSTGPGSAAAALHDVLGEIEKRICAMPAEAQNHYVQHATWLLSSVKRESVH